jgi:hypothetical protein
LFAYSVLSTKSCINKQNDAKRWATNYKVEANKLQSNIAKTVTIDEFDKLYNKYTDLANKIGINHNKIKTVIKTEYKYKDTTIVTNTTVIDTAKRTLQFTTNNDCYQIAGTVVENKVTVDFVEMFDVLTTYVYSEKEEWFLGIKKFWKKPYIKAKVYSECVGDTVSVQENIQIIK